MALADSLQNGRILIVRLARLGDVILLIPALRALRRRLPNARISVMTDQRFAPALAMCSAADVIALDRIGLRDGGKLAGVAKLWRILQSTRRARYDLLVDLHGFRETNVLAAWSRARWRLGLRPVNVPGFPSCFNLPVAPQDPALQLAAMYLKVLEPLGALPQPGDHLLEIRAQDAAAAEKLLRDAGITGQRPLIGFYPGASLPEKTWPAEKFAALAARLAQQLDADVILFSGLGDAEVSRRVAALLNASTSRAPRLALSEGHPIPLLAALMSRCRLLVSNDTGPMHLGAAAGAPTLGLFCSRYGMQQIYAPLGPHSRALSESVLAEMNVEVVMRHAMEVYQANVVTNGGLNGAP